MQLDKDKLAFQFNKRYFELKGKIAENIVHELAGKTFLTDWCFLNPQLPNGRELCDLLVVFDEIAIIWQIKDLEPDEKGIYKKNILDKNLRQISGAKRQLFKLKTKITLNNPLRGSVVFDPTSIKETFLISVLVSNGKSIYPLIERAKGDLIHIFAREGTQIVLTELDTISDFCRYLKEKERFIKSIDKKGSFIRLWGEEDLLGLYIKGNRSLKLLEKDKKYIDVIGKVWEDLQKNPKFKEKKQQDKISYLWDAIIKTTHTGSKEYEFVARKLARLDRFQRRYLSKVFAGGSIKAHNDNKHDMFRRVINVDGISYAFLYMDDPEPRKDRKALLKILCYVAKTTFPKNRWIIGIATEKKIRSYCSYDFCIMEMPTLDKKNQEMMEKIKARYGFFVNPVKSRFSEDEYIEFEKKHV